MITTEIPIGKALNYLYKNESFYKNEILIKQIRNLVDLILIRSKNMGVDETLKSLEDDLFKLRLEFISDPKLLNEIIQNLNDSIEERIKFQYSKTTNHQNLETAYVNSLHICKQISSNQFNLLSDESLNTFKNIPKLNYKSFIDLLNSFPGKDSKLIISYLNSSIALDFAFVTSELIFDDKLKLKKTEIEKLILILKNSIEDYALLSYQFGIWKPKDIDESQWIRNIKIRISLFESKQLSDNSVSSNDIKNMLVA